MAKLNFNKINRQQSENRISVKKIEHSKKNFDNAWKQAIQTTTYFLTGKYSLQDIAKIIETDKQYCNWIVENKPHSIAARQILHYLLNKNNLK